MDSLNDQIDRLSDDDLEGLALAMLRDMYEASSVEVRFKIAETAIDLLLRLRLRAKKVTPRRRIVTAEQARDSSPRPQPVLKKTALTHRPFEALKR